MKKDIDKALKQRLEAAWDVPPMSHGSRKRFIAGLECVERPHRNRQRVYIGVLSALAAVITGIVFLLVQPLTDVDSTLQPMPQQVKLTIAEVRGYYKAKLWSESEYIVMLAAELNEDTREALLQEVKKMETEPETLVERILTEPMSDDLKIFYITQVYSSHLRSMQHIHSLLDETMAQK
ncbi:MAG: hypothetical protein K2J00_01785 [Bacteroidaceae bacterium]|nr:hypothetical protein [Bacteroidaceae bacterium]